MSVAAAVRINSPDAMDVVVRAAEFAEKSGTTCYVISVVDELPHGSSVDRDETVVMRNLEVIARVHATPVMQEGAEVPAALVSAARWFGVRTLFVQNARPRLFRRSVVQRLIALDPPFEVVVIQTPDAAART